MLRAMLVVRSAISGTTLPLCCVFPDIEKAPNRLRQGTIEGAHRRKRHINKPMFAASFHELDNAAAMIDMHDDEQAGSVVHLDNLPRYGDFFGTTIRFDNNTGNGGIH